MDRLETCSKFIHRFTKNAINGINNAKKCKKSRIPEFRTVSKYANFWNIRPIWEWIFLIEIKYFFEKFLLISFRIRIVSNRTTSISVEVYEYCRYLVRSTEIKKNSFMWRTPGWTSANRWLARKLWNYFIITISSLTWNGSISC